MRLDRRSGLVALATTALLAGSVAPALAQDQAIGAPERADQEYVWVSNFSSLPLFVERVYPALEQFAKDFNVKVRVAGPPGDDLAGYIAAVEQVCAGGPAGV